MISKFIKPLLIIIIVLVMGVFAFNIADRQFRLSNIYFPELKVDNEELVSSEEFDVLKTILAQPYTYLDRGKQSFAFLSQNGKYVLKFFDAGALYSSYLFFFNQNRLIKKKKRLFEGYRIAYEYDREHSGLLYMQLAPTNLNGLQANVKDLFGIRHTINLSLVPFVIQKKAVQTRTVITSLLLRGDLIAVKAHLRQIIDMYVSGYQRGIYDRDHNFMYNTGFVDGQPIRFDVGRLQLNAVYKEYAVYSKDLEKLVFVRLAGWMGRHFPQYREAIVIDMQSKLKEIAATNNPKHDN